MDSEGRKHGGTYQWLDGSSYEAILNQVFDMEKDISVGQMVNITRICQRSENGEEYTLGLMTQFIVAFSLMERDTAKVFLNQQTEAFIVVNGLMI